MSFKRIKKRLGIPEEPLVVTRRRASLDAEDLLLKRRILRSGNFTPIPEEKQRSSASGRKRDATRIHDRKSSVRVVAKESDGRHSNWKRNTGMAILMSLGVYGYISRDIWLHHGTSDSIQQLASLALESLGLKSSEKS